MPKVSVVIPTFNRAQIIAESLQSVINQTYKDIEAIVVDDGSTDNTREVVGSFKDPRISYKYQENRGVSAARNAGIKVSSGEYIAFLDSDDIWLSPNLELKVKLLDSRPDIAIACSDAYMFDARVGVTLGRRWHDKPFHYWVNPQRAAKNPLKELLYRGCFITPQAAVVRRRAFEEVGYFDESLRTHEDWDMFVRIVRRFPIGTIDIPLVRIRIHDVSLSDNWDRMYLGAVAVLNKALNSNLFSYEELKILKKRLARTHYSYGQAKTVNGEIAAGREKLCTSIRINPWSFKPYFYFVVSFMGNKIIATMKSTKNRL